LEPFPQKPRRMHWRTYRRPRDQANAAKAEADYLLAESMLGQFSTSCRLAENANAGAAMAGPSLLRPPALH
jgi:hypothetical protein